MTMNAAFSYFFLPALALILTVVLMPLVRMLALKAGYVDEPGGRKHHAEPIPPIGGLVIFCVFIFLSAYAYPDVGNMAACYGALALILITGLVDDARGVPALIKFIIHFTAAWLIVVPGGMQIETLGNIIGFGELRFGELSGIVFSVACVVYIINAINMMDGLDGLAGGKCLIILLWLMAACGIYNWWEAFTGVAILAGAVTGFLYYNMQHPFRERASVFLGDAGSMALGLMIAWFCIGLSQGDHPVVAPVSIAWIIALPIIDAFGLLVARLKDGQHPFKPDRRHFHHHFLNAGFNVRQATFLILCWSVVLGAFGYLGLMAGIPEPVLGWLWILLWLSHTVLVIKPEPFIRVLTKLRGPDTPQETQP